MRVCDTLPACPEEQSVQPHTYTTVQYTRTRHNKLKKQQPHPQQLTRPAGFCPAGLLIVTGGAHTTNKSNNIHYKDHI